MSQLFVRTDLERAARLAIQGYVESRLGMSGEGGRVPRVLEECVASAVSVVAEERPAYYDEATVKRMLLYAHHWGAQDTTGGRKLVDDEQLLRACVDYAQRS